MSLALPTLRAADPVRATGSAYILDLETSGTTAIPQAAGSGPQRSESTWTIRMTARLWCNRTSASFSRQRRTPIP